ncbi:MAG: DUF2235 domain-containing protein [Desulfobacterales bacterium]|nr:DUF2235 domain-containing protein [Desulfobacterales bacterium]
MSRNLIICCDGTGNEIKENQSNVLKFYRLIKKDENQIGFYDPGVGTISDSSPWDRLKNQAKGVFGLITGYGLDRNVLEAYRFLALNYRQGDNIYLFGFSRGAYTVRVLAGFVNMVGLLSPNNDNLMTYALTAYKQSSTKNDFTIAWRVQKVMETRRVTIRFMGCWDTVSSVIVPRPDRWYIPSLEKLPYTITNPCVQAFRHAMAIDERRRMFRLLPWKENQKFKTNPFVKDTDAADQDTKQVWFAGVHSDIGGGYPERESGAAKLSLKWMVEEAEANGIVFKKEMVSRLVNGKLRENDTVFYAAPDANADLHDSMNWAWSILEWLPKSDKYKEWKSRPSFWGWYQPKAEPRPMGENQAVHPSVYERTVYCGSRPYKPVNLKQ